MLSSQDREAIALQKFALIAPVLNGQVSNQKDYFKDLAAKPVLMPHYGTKQYAPKSFYWWLYLYRCHGLEGLKPGYRSDRGQSRRITEAMALAIAAKRAAKPRLNGTMLYDELIKDGVFTPDKVSLATFYRYLARHSDLAAPADTTAEAKEIKRFAHQWVNELWQGDIMYGPYLKVGRGKKQTYLLAFIDDASRLILHAQFFWEQNYTAVRMTLKEAILRRGVPKMIYTDNGKVYRSGQLAVVCASLGCSLLHAEPFAPYAKGKIERFFRTVRARFLPRLNLDKIASLPELNLAFWQWLEEDYQRKIHSSLGLSPLDFFLSQSERVRIFPDPALLDEYFLLRVMRKVNHDATFSLDNILYETKPELAGLRLEVRYDPQWLSLPTQPLFLYHEGLKVGEARQVDLAINATLKRRGRGRPTPKDQVPTAAEEAPPPAARPAPSLSISFADLIDREEKLQETRGGAV
jgi:transposase InsO family protein